MRVISGSRKGHKLFAPKGINIRPSEDRLKESLFNIISPIKYESVVLDLFAGTGSIGIEFLSRGSKIAYFVDNSRESISYINKNLEHTKLKEKANVLNIEAKKALAIFKKDSITFEYIYLDPPYADFELFNSTINLIEDLSLLAKDGILIVEHDGRVTLDDNYLKFIKIDQRKYGKNLLTFFKYKEVLI
jgi:16S rRNA (guanine(966)-N(2))-methyltransferase RsmD